MRVPDPIRPESSLRVVGTGTMDGDGAGRDERDDVTESGTGPEAAGTPRPAAPARALIGVLRFYQRWISPMFLPHCRFHPTCSAYAVEALRVHGLLRGTVLTVVRLLKCAPWHPGGLDPVPPRRRRRPETPETSDSGRTAPRGAGAPTSEEQASC
ncbi:hypothetical protein Acsp07_45450 [Actinomycetospora sp. NBRC 106378]|nr:hypothetical protein Acsp07_45450 [Actinomycetospora sp. NBRC 106378]